MKNLIKKITTGAVLMLLLAIPVLVDAVTLNSISIITPANKNIDGISYTVGEPLDLTGLVVHGNYTDEGDYSEVVSITEANISGFDSSVPTASQTLTITFEGKTTTYDISVAGPILNSISIITPANKNIDGISYTVGEPLDLTGLVVHGNYTDEGDYSEVVSITEANISGFDSSVPTASQTLTITFEGKTTTYDISVVAAPVEESNSRSGGGRSGSRRVVTQAQTAPLSTAEGEVLGESTFAFNMDLSLGMSGNDVKELQERLRAEGFFTHPVSTGYFGQITLAAVKAYQQAHFAEIGYVTGFVGPLTRAVLNK